MHVCLCVPVYVLLWKLDYNARVIGAAWNVCDAARAPNLSVNTAARSDVNVRPYHRTRYTAAATTTASATTPMVLDAPAASKVRAVSATSASARHEYKYKNKNTRCEESTRVFCVVSFFSF